MSTEDQNRSVVTARKSADVDALMDDITSGKLLGRKIEMHNEKNDSISNFDVVLTREECEILRQDSRVYAVRYGSKAENGYELGKHTLDVSRNYDKTTTTSSNNYNWAFPACLADSNPFDGVDDIDYQHPYTLIGEGVDVVINDSGIQADHPEWLNQAGTYSRLQQIDWPTESGYTFYTQGPDFYTDQEGHGTHVAGTAAGRLYGWAKGANIYVSKIFDTDAFGTSASLNMIRAWHTNKNGSRPTVMNMSWGYSTSALSMVGGSYRGTTWTGNYPQTQYGILNEMHNYGRTQSRVASVDSDLLDCYNAGIIMCASAGNDSYKCDVSGGLDYDNYWTKSDGSHNYYHRGATPAAPTGVISVGAIAADTYLEYKAYFSATGPRVDIYAPGEAIMSSVAIDSNDSGGCVDYPLDANFKAVKLQGTSMASPQVTGLLACLMGSRPHYTPDDAKNWLVGTSNKLRFLTTFGDYTDMFSIQGGNNRYLHWPFSSPTVLNWHK